MGSDAFAVSDTASIERIFMMDKSANSALLERDEVLGWQVNKEFKARSHEVNNLLATIHDVRVVRQIPESHHDEIVANLASKNTRVEIWGTNGKMLKEYFVGWETRTNEGNYMWQEGLDEVYIVNIPGFVGHLSSRYFLDENSWRDRTVFAYALEDIKRIGVTYHPHPTMKLADRESFYVDVIARDSFWLRPGNDMAEVLAPDKREVFNYLSHFEEINYETLADNVSHKDSVLASLPFCTMVVTNTAGEANSIDIFYKPVGKRTKTQYDAQGNLLPFDMERFYASINGGRDFVIIQEFVFRKLFASYNWFFEDTI